MMADKTKGFQKERFTELKGDSFDCAICYLVAREPKECLKCGNMYCGPCIDDWTSKRKECPIGCTDTNANIRPISGALAKIYRNLDLKCSMPNCNAVVKLCEVEEHEALCQLSKCEFFEICGSKVKPDLKEEGVCGLICQFLKKAKTAQSSGNFKNLYEDLKTLQKTVAIPGKDPSGGLPAPSANLVKFRWDTVKIGQGIEISNDKKTAFLKENAYLFRSIIGDTPLMGGIHYWEIHGDSRTENELKIGVAMRKDFNYNTAFCDYEFGFAYYGLGQLRHNSNSIGGAYGKKFKKSGVLGVCLNMNKGTLSFALDGEYMGVAYESEGLKKGPAYAAVSLLHHAGCTLETGKPVPAYFPK